MDIFGFVLASCIPIFCPQNIYTHMYTYMLVSQLSDLNGTEEWSVNLERWVIWKTNGKYEHKYRVSL